ncbi:hypothetical protein TMatcc_002078 [Talaromyces marneffei ATCC 18224]
MSDSNKNRNNSGRRVKHSRGGCSTCKQRKIRCPENKPICNRCISDNRVCNYGIQLQWEDDSRKRGIKHGRTTRADRVALSAAKTTTWLGFPRGQGGRYFLNTFTSDIDGKFVVPVMQGLDFERDMIWKRDAMLHITPTRMPTLNFAALRNETLDMDGILFDYYDRSVSHSIVLLDSPTNLFRNLILPLATTNETVMHMVLALSALSLAATGQTQYYPLALRHKQRSMRLIREQIASNAISAANDANVIVILMLSVFEIDPSIGCSYELVNIISRITDLARDMRDPAANKRTWHSETRQVEEQLDTLIQLLPPTYLQHMDALNAEILTPPPTSSGDPIAILLNTSLLIQTAAKLFFQATLRSLNPQTPQARSLITEIIGYTQQLSPTHLRSAHLWSLFVGAVYSTGDDDERVWFLDQFDILEKKSQGLVARGVLTRVKEIVDNVWKRRDLDCDVIGVWESQGDRIGDWEKYVQPLSEGLSLG